MMRVLGISAVLLASVLQGCASTGASRGSAGAPSDSVITALGGGLILNGELDDWTPASFCQRLLARAGPQGQPVELKTYPGAYHDFDEPQGKVRQLGNIGSKNGGSATLGPDPAARADALERVPAFLRRLTAP